ncbi:MAG: hypothetical protein KDC35_20875 [Acidobacteria bacterium]|nr:hypothetical protein [Acidobacteriota bacterium]
MQDCWDTLAHLGAPLTTSIKLDGKPSWDALLACLKKANRSLKDPLQPDFERKRDVFWAMCLALKTHYPPVWSQLDFDLDIAAMPNRVHKLYRIAKAQLASYP